MKRVALFGCKTTTKFFMENLSTQIGLTHFITISSKLAARHEVADYHDSTELARSLGLQVYEAKKYSLKDEADLRDITTMGLDLAFVIGWQRLLPAQVLNTISIGAFGMHGSSMNLPLGRGRSPLNWSIIEGRQAFYTNLFKYDADIDSGDILDTFLFTIRNDDTSETLHLKNSLAMTHLVSKNIKLLLSNDFTLKKQIDRRPTYYPKRSPQHSLIDWSRDIFYLERFIRAVTRPFNGAYTFSGDRRVSIIRAAIFETDLVDFGHSAVEVGTVVEVFPGGKFLVRCNGGLLLVHDWEGDVRINKGSIFGNGEEKVFTFSMNPQGYYDVEESH